MAASWRERFGSITTWSSGCPICRGEQFLHLPLEEVFSPFRSADQARCPCWLLFMSMQVLWEEDFPKGYLSLNLTSSYPIDQLTGASHASWFIRHPNSDAWEMSVADHDALYFWVTKASVAAAKGLSLVLYGDKGTGKSSLATALAKEFVKRRGLDASGPIKKFSVKWLVSDALYADSGKGYRSKDLIVDCLRSDLLVLDDLRLAYKGFTSSDYVERLHTLLQYRSANLLPTIITSNKIAQQQDYVSNSVVEFLGISSDSVPGAFGRYRFIQLTNTALRPMSDWSC